VATTITEASAVTLSESQVVHLIAHCWWKKGFPLGDLVVSAIPEFKNSNAAATAAATVPTTTNLDETPEEERQLWKLVGCGPEFCSLVNDWTTVYLPKRAEGLASALERWMTVEGGLITSVRDDEMD
jgi:hypothetical protein